MDVTPKIVTATPEIPATASPVDATPRADVTPTVETPATASPVDATPRADVTATPENTDSSTRWCGISRDEWSGCDWDGIMISSNIFIVNIK